MCTLARIRALLFLLALLLPRTAWAAAPPQAENRPPATTDAVRPQPDKVNHQYTVFDRIVNNNVDSRYFHPQLDEEFSEFFVVTAQEEDYLKAAVYTYFKKSNVYSTIPRIYYFYNPQNRDFSGMPVRFTLSGECFQFADGTRLCRPPLPPDVHKIGSPELWYEVRWRRVYGNYYLITLFRGEGRAVEEVLMTERDGKDLTPVLGESSKAQDLRGYGGSMGGEKKRITKRERVNGEEQYIVYTLIPVQEKDLPPDFPRGLVRWIP